MSIIEFPNRKSSKIKNFSLDELAELIKTLYEQTNYACNCYYIGSRLYTNLSKYDELNDKWYIFALNSLDDNMILILIKLYNDQDNEISLYNILNYLSIDVNFNNLFLTEEDKEKFKKYINEYNVKYSKLRKKLIIRRNNWQVHINSLILDKTKFEQLISLTQKECFDLLYYALHTLRKVYKLLFNKDLPLENHYSAFTQIDKYIALLDKNGDL